MSLKDVVSVATAVIAAVGGAGAIIVGLSSFIGRLWADRLMASVKSENDRELERLRAELTATNAAQLEHFRTELEVARTKALGAHADKLAMYRMGKRPTFPC